MAPALGNDMGNYLEMIKPHLTSQTIIAGDFNEALTESLIEYQNRDLTRPDDQSYSAIDFLFSTKIGTIK